MQKSGSSARFSASLELAGDDRLAFLFEDVGGPFQEQDSEDVLLELRGVHVASEDVSGGEEVTFELGEGEHVHTVGGGRDSTSGRCHPGLRFPHGPQPR